MRIEQVELRLIRMRLAAPFETSFGREVERSAIIVAMKGEGQVGYSECVATSHRGSWYSYETTGTAWHVLKDYMIPSILGKDLASQEQLLGCLKEIRGHNMARASLEMAFCDLLAKAQGVSLSRFLGGLRDRIESGVSIGIQPNVRDLLRLIDGYLREGYRRIKLKIKPGWDIEVLKAVRDAYPDVPLMVDANGAYTLDDVEILRKMDEYGLMMVEQPLDYDDLVDHAQLQRQVKTPICLDESVKGPDDARKAIWLGSCRIINVKPGRVGGHHNSKLIHDYCMNAGLPIWIGGMLETGIGRAHNVALACLPNVKLPNDISASRRYYEEDIIDPPFELKKDGTIMAPSGPGIGVEVLEDKLDKITTKERRFKIT